MDISLSHLRFIKQQYLISIYRFQILIALLTMVETLVCNDRYKC